MTFKVLLLRRLHNLADERTECRLGRLVLESDRLAEALAVIEKNPWHAGAVENTAHGC